MLFLLYGEATPINVHINTYFYSYIYIYIHTDRENKIVLVGLSEGTK
jgi:hypothetical protein